MWHLCFHKYYAFFSILCVLGCFVLLLYIFSHICHILISIFFNLRCPMNKSLFYYMTVGFFFTIFAGTFLFFSYDLSSHNPLVGMFAPVSDSPWEYLKMIFFPSFFYFLSGWFFFIKSYPSFIRSCFSGLLAGTFSVLIILYTYTGILGTHYFSLDLAAFLIAIYLVYYLSYQLISLQYQVLSMPLLVSLVVLSLVGFFSFTYFPPDLPLFKEWSLEISRNLF